MRTLELNSWKQTGTVCFWRYTENVKNYPGWHLAADQVGHASLLDLVHRLRNAAELPASRTVKTTFPSTKVLAVTNNRHSPIVAATRIRVTKSNAIDEWTTVEADADVTVRLGVQHLDGFIRWLSDPSAAFDSTYGSSPPVWFWGLIDAKTPSAPSRAPDE